jgi:hypothetical protein
MASVGAMVTTRHRASMAEALGGRFQVRLSLDALHRAALPHRCSPGLADLGRPQRAGIMGQRQSTAVAHCARYWNVVLPLAVLFERVCSIVYQID